MKNWKCWSPRLYIVRHCRDSTGEFKEGPTGHRFCRKVQKGPGFESQCSHRAISWPRPVNVNSENIKLGSGKKKGGGQ